MKAVILFLLIIFSFTALAQKRDTIIDGIHANSTKIITKGQNRVTLVEGPNKDTKVKGETQVYIDRPSNVPVDPAYYIDGKLVSDIKGLNPSDIATIQVLKDNADTLKYGPKAKNGVLIIITKAYAQKHNIKK